jgi:uncharacterized membrane protein
MVIQSFADCVYKRSQIKGAIPETFLVYQSYAFGLTAFLLVLGTATFPTGLTAWKYGPPCGLIAFSAYYCFLRSLKGGQVSVNTMIFRLSFVLTAFLAALFLKEAVTLRKVSGLAVATFAVLSLTVLPTLLRGRTSQKTAESAERSRSLAFALAAMLCLGVLSFLYKLAASEGVPGPNLIFIQATFFSPAAMIYAALRRRFVWHPVTVAHGLGAGVLLSLALTFLVSALSRGEAGLMVPINQMSFVLTAALAAPWFKEAWTASKTAAVILAAGAVILLSG